MNSKDFYNNQSIVSYDQNKVWIDKENDNYYFYKKTTEFEVYNLRLMREKILNKFICIFEKRYDLSVPQIINFNNNLLKLEYCNGKNLELYLRDKKSHDIGVIFLNELLRFFIKNNIYWIDFAPRNILINDNKIIFVDFEKGFMDKNTNVKDYLRNNVYEEYGLFLLNSERFYQAEDIFSIQNENNSLVPVDLIKSDRYRFIAKLSGYNQYMTKQEYLKILKLIIDVETPYVEKGNIIFPGVYLDRFMVNLLSKNPVEEYAKEVLRLYKKRN